MNAARLRTEAAAVDRYRAARDAYTVACAKADAAFARYFAKREAGETTNGAALSRLENLANYASQAMAAAQTSLYLLDLDPWDIDDEDGVERSPV